MSCGSPHATPCTTVLSLVHAYTDGETTQVQRVDIVRHLDECAPCADEFAIVRAVKLRVHGSCGGQAAPEHLRAQIVTRIRQVSVSYREIDPGE